jgi:ATP-dependent DNA ligase
VSQFNQLLSRKRGAIFYAFDLLWLDGADLRRRPLLERKARLAELVRVSKIEDAVVRAVIHDDDGVKLQVDVVGIDLTALIDTRQVVE